MASLDKEYLFDFYNKKIKRADFDAGYQTFISKTERYLDLDAPLAVVLSRHDDWSTFDHAFYDSLEYAESGTFAGHQPVFGYRDRKTFTKQFLVILHHFEPFLLFNYRGSIDVTIDQLEHCFGVKQETFSAGDRLENVYVQQGGQPIEKNLIEFVTQTGPVLMMDSGQVFVFL